RRTFPSRPAERAACRGRGIDRGAATRTGLVSRPAVFLDRDGTLMKDVHYIRMPDQVELLQGAGPAVQRLNDMGFPVIIVTNQSGIARGFFTEADYDRVRDR